MQSEFKPASVVGVTEIRDKKKKKENFITGEITETIEAKQQLKHIKGEYTLEFFDQDGNLTEKIEAENATPIIYSKLGTSRQLDDLGIKGKGSKDIWGNFSYPRFFDDGFIFFTQENNLQTEHVQGAIPSGQTVGLTTIDSAYTGSATYAGSVNKSLSTTEAGHNVTTLTYVSDFSLEKSNGTFDTVWLGHVSNQRYESSFEEMRYKVGGHFKHVDFLSPKFSSMIETTFSKNESYPQFFPIDGYTHFGQNFENDSNADMQGYFIYDSAPDTNEATFQKVTVLNDAFNNCEAGGAAIYRGKPAIIKRMPTATNSYEVVYFDLSKDSVFQLTNPQVIKLSTASLPNHADLRLMHIKSFENALYAIFKPVETSWDAQAVCYIVKYNATGSTYQSHTTFNFDSGSGTVAQDKFKLQGSTDIYRINNVDYFVIAYNHGFDHRNAPVYYCAITNENKVLSKPQLNAFVEVPERNYMLWRQLEPNGLFFSQTGELGNNSMLRLAALMPPFSHTKIQTTTKDASQSMRLTYSVKIYHNIAEQYLPRKTALNSTLEENNLHSEEIEENNSIFSKIKSVFSSK